MDEHRVTGAARNAGGRVEEGFGRVTRETKSQVQGVIDQAQGTAENLYGQASGRGRTKDGILVRRCRSPHDRGQTVHGRCHCTCAGLALRQDASTYLGNTF
jgi:uncharacterized protein YjbJ (UPF0337 family)